MSKSVIIVSALLLGGCSATLFTSSYGLRAKGGSDRMVSLRRVAVHRGPTVYVGKLSCEAPVAVRVLSAHGVEELAFLRNDRPLRGCGINWASVVVPAGHVLGSADLGRVVSRSGYVVVCVRGDSRPSEVVIEAICQ